jgi:hypothetical protein
MAYEIKDMSGSLFKNEKREKDTHPNARGSCKIGGVEYWMDAWTKKDKNGNPWQSISFKPKEARQAPKTESKDSTRSRTTVGGGYDDDDPFK